MSVSLDPMPVVVQAPVEDVRLKAATDSLDAAMKATKGQKEQLPDHAYLNGEWGLTGICVGYGLECARLITQQGNEAAIPDLLNGWPQESIRHLVKLFILAIYQTIKKETDPGKITRTPENRDLINQIIQNYEALFYGRTGLKIAEIYPGPTYFESKPMSELCTEFGEGHDHYLYVLGNGTDRICAWHVIYVNPVLGIIADSENCFFWKIEESDRDLFPQVFQHFIKQGTYKTNDACRLLLRQEGAPSKIPLIVSRIFQRTRTAVAIARHSGLGLGACYLYHINQFNPLVACCTPPDVKNVQNKLDSLIQKYDIGPELVSFLRLNLSAIPHLDPHSINLIFKLSLEPAQNESILATLKQIETLGPKVYPFLSFFIRKILRELRIKIGIWENCYPQHITEVFLPGLLAIHTKCGKKSDLTSLLDTEYRHAKQIPFYEQIIDAGANPNGPDSLYYDGDSILDTALQKKDSDVGRERSCGELIDFFQRKGARSVRTPVVNELETTLYSTIKPELFDFVQANLEEIGSLDPRIYEKLVDCKFIFLVDSLNDPIRTNQLLEIIDKIQRLGSKADVLTSEILKGVFRAIPDICNGNYPPHLFESFIPGLLKLRKRLKNPFKLNELDTAPKHVPYYQALIIYEMTGVLKI